MIKTAKVELAGDWLNNLMQKSATKPVLTGYRLFRKKGVWTLSIRLTSFRIKK